MKRSFVWLLSLGLVMVTAIPMAGAQSDSLVGTRWQLESFTVPQGEIMMYPGHTITLEFQSATQLGGSGGCNTYGANYSASGGSLSIDAIYSTKMACAEGMQEEQNYFQMLQEAYRYDVSSEHLTIWYGNQQQMNFVRAGGVTPDGSGEIMPPEDRFEDRSAPVSLLASYYNAINRREYARAYSYWDSPRQTYSNFADGFANTISVQVIVQPPTRYGGAAGSIYAGISTVLIAVHTDGTQHMFAGCFNMRASNVVSSSESASSQTWNIYSADLEEVSLDSSIPALLRQSCTG